MATCLFCRIVAGTERSWPVWADERHLAFLTPFPNTPGFTVVVPRRHMTSDVLRLDADAFVALMLAVRTVGALLDEALGTKRTAFIAEGMGVDHAHVKLLPLHGIPDGPWSPVLADARTFSTTYAGYVTSLDGPRAADHELDAIQARIARVRDGSAG